ncbi:MAG: hypothetical protein ACOC0E_13035 [Spirochaetota bacterium]
MRFVSALACNVRLQLRHGFYLAYFVVAAAYIVVLRLAAHAARDTLLVLFVFSDPAILGLYFVGGLVLLARQEGSLRAMMVSPLRLGEYHAAIAGSLALLSLAAAGAITLGGVAGSSLGAVSWGWAALGVLLTALFTTFIGLGLVGRTASVVEFAFLVTPVALVFALPLLDYFRIVRSAWFYLVPTHASLTLIGSLAPASRPHPRQAAISLAALVLWNVAAFLWSRKEFARWVVPTVSETA